MSAATTMPCRGHGVGQEVDVTPGIEPVHRQHQPERGHLVQVLRVLAAVTAFARDVPGHGQMPGDELVTESLALRVAFG